MVDSTIIHGGGGGGGLWWGARCSAHWFYSADHPGFSTALQLHLSPDKRLSLETCGSCWVQRSSRAKAPGDVGFVRWTFRPDSCLLMKFEPSASQVMSVSSSVGTPSFPPHALSKSRNGKGLASCSLHQGAVSHFGLEYGWQAKENKNHLHRRRKESFMGRYRSWVPSGYTASIFIWSKKMSFRIRREIPSINLRRFGDVLLIFDHLDRWDGGIYKCYTTQRWKWNQRGLWSSEKSMLWWSFGCHVLVNDSYHFSYRESARILFSSAFSLPLWKRMPL